MKIDLVETLKDENFVEVGEHFKQLVRSRKYHEAKDYLNNLNQEQKDFIRITEKYKFYLKTLSMSSL